MMKKLKSSTAAKVIAMILYCLMSFTLVVSALGAILLESCGAYNTSSYEQIQQNALEDMAWSRLNSAGHMYKHGANPDSIFPNSNFRFAVFDSEGKELYSNKGDGKVMLRLITTMEPDYHITNSESSAGSQEVILTVLNNDTHETVQVASGVEFEKWKAENSHEFIGYVMKDMEYHDEFYDRLQLLDTLFPYNYTLLAGAVISALLIILLFAFFLAAAGHKKGAEGIHLSFIDKIPLDVFLVFATAAVFMPFSLAMEAGLSWNIASYIVVGLVTVWTAVSLLICLMSLAVRIKSKTLWTNCLCVKICRRCWKSVKTVCRFMIDMVRSLSLNKRWFFGLALVLFAELLLMMLSQFSKGIMLILFLANAFLTVSFFSWCISCFMRLSKGAKELACGSMNTSIDTKYMRGELKEHAEDLMNIRLGMDRAVKERMRSERFQSELITNVSHDIKTPLTSIINYVDLLEKEELNNDTARGYVEILSRQSGKLKKLLEDLIEASKASTGVLAVNMEVCELGVLLDQCAGEYSERLQNAGLKLMVTKPAEQIRIMADGRHMWRILDNLMSNVLKYAQPGTRVYLGLSREGNRAQLSIRNISRDELNISGEELMERFVRGDSSRSTDGSGLGLAIARSLCQLQHGQMSLSVDGDLFKVVLEFDIMA